MSGFALGIAPKWGKKICLPDKEFRYLRQCCYSHHPGFDDAGQVISAWLCMSPCRSDHLFATPPQRGVRHMVSEDSRRSPSVHSSVPPTSVHGEGTRLERFEA